MKSKHFKVGTKVEVLWQDSATFPGWRLNTVGMAPGRVATIGVVMASNEDALIVSTSLADNGGFLDPCVIPWPCIEAVQTIP